ncbi:DUF2235 domain-containing protein [Cupriavidus sp. AU9028]|uniref:DUF2235 domain-containing protein n=1 Tax=Cupriavidus sp. AU9028 TaxID=2871157 RepID=UPI001C97832A|nr:DUF2235 domain-containing protein [Cupriavidus sp. AU9028]MBY4899154.1 DUF2235 domain-containing protein [Cupriavidus sp. AU9028]
MPKNLAVFFDGTWNEPNDRTNVHALYRAATDNDHQDTRYIEGVGTKGQGLWSAIDRLAGGAFGAGLSANIREGYQWLCQRYAPGDRLFLFGFSRGAYSARSLAGMIRNCGLLREPDRDGVAEAYALYRDDDGPDAPGALRFRQARSHETDIHFLGVWDTVGRLGIPVDGISVPGFSSFYRFHDAELSNHVVHAYQALATNEFRKPYAPTYWTRKPASTPRPADRPVEQRWFVGAHSDVGGGYEDGALATLPGRWLQWKAMQAGMQFDPTATIAMDYDRCVPHDSWGEFNAIARFFVEREARHWDGTALGLQCDPRLRQRLQDSDLLQNEPQLRKRILELPDGDTVPA